MKRAAAIAALSLATAHAEWDVQADTWAATDGLGRDLPAATEVGPPKPDRTVGMFYFLWHQGNQPVHDLSKLLAASQDQPALGPVGAFHHWGEPLFGYYRGDDAFVIRKHAQMLSDAGVDVLLLDVTNALTYDHILTRLCEVLTDVRTRGQKAPSIAFLANSHAGKTVQHLLETFYKPGKFPDLWFRWQGKPLLLSPPEELSDEAKSFFTLRHSWAWTKGQKWFGDGRDKWPWLDHTPQTPGWHVSPDQPEQIVVCAAEHPISTIGRSFHAGKQPPPDAWKTAEGAYFAEQWQRALQVAPPFVLVTGWNEWIAQRFIDKDGKMSMAGRRLAPGDSFFVDQYSPEFSRDLEPMKGGFGDAYYYQLVANVRRYKGARTVPALSGGPIVIDGKFDDWKAVTPEWRDTLGDPVLRDHEGWQGEPRFVDRSGRNDLAVAKVAATTDTLSFYVRTREPLAAPGEDWMHLLVDADQNATTGWLGYDFLVTTSGVAQLDREGKRTPLAGVSVSHASANNELELALPRSTVGLATRGSFDFKWTDAIPVGSDAGVFTLKGDAAPNDRFNYRATLAATNH